MKFCVFYNKKYNIDLGLFKALHPFDGSKFRTVAESIKGLEMVQVISPLAPIMDEEINSFVDSFQKLLLKKKRYILRALEVPFIPLVPFSWIDKHILLAMRWGVSGTIDGAKSALMGTNCWNLSGGYHHASRATSEGFCIYNDVGMAVDRLRKESMLKTEDKILIIDLDVHHGNGNAYVFMEDSAVTILDIYNDGIYPMDVVSKERVDISVPLLAGTDNTTYLNALESALNEVTDSFKLAFVIAGTDVLSCDPLGGFNLSVNDCASRDALVASRLKEMNIPFVFVGGGGYSKSSAQAIIEGIKKVSVV